VIIIEFSGTRPSTALAKALELVLENTYNLETRQEVTPETEGVQLLLEQDGIEKYPVGRFSSMPKLETLNFHLEIAGLLN